MAGTRARRRWRLGAAAACLASSAVWLGGAAAAPDVRAVAGRPAVSDQHAANQPAPNQPAAGRVLQLNLCNSGIAGCFTGRAVAVAVGLIARERPSVVTLNEVCRGDVTVLARALSATAGGRPVASAFAAAGDRRTGRPWRCVNHQEYGIGVLVRAGAAGGYRSHRGVYVRQDAVDPEQRVWLCVAQPTLIACTTHTDSHSAAVALAQCRQFFDDVLVGLPGRAGNVPFVLGADLNLPAHGSPGPGDCGPRADPRVDDGGRQDVVAGPSLTVRRRTVIDMQGATDHPALLVEFGAA